jgi:predicted dehydrogenase
VTVDVALIGAGRWGRRLLAALVAHPRMRVRAVIDCDRAARQTARRLAPAAMTGARVDALPTGLQAAFVASPSSMHAGHAALALERNLDVFVEKPLALDRRDAESLATLADGRGRVAMVGHVLRFDSRVSDFVSALRGGAVGELRELRAQRLTTSGSPDPLWTLAPHDLATLFAIDPSEVEHVAMTDGPHGHVLTLRLASGLKASVEVATTATHSRRQTRVRGTDGLLVLDEMGTPTKVDALTCELDHFVDCVETRRRPRTCFAEGLAVVDVLARASQLGDETARCEVQRGASPRVASR